MSTYVAPEQRLDDREVLPLRDLTRRRLSRGGLTLSGFRGRKQDCRRIAVGVLTSRERDTLLSSSSVALAGKFFPCWISAFPHRTEHPRRSGWAADRSATSLRCCSHEPDVAAVAVREHEAFQFGNVLHGILDAIRAGRGCCAADQRVVDEPRLRIHA